MRIHSPADFRTIIQICLTDGMMTHLFRRLSCGLQKQDFPVRDGENGVYQRPRRTL